MNRIPVVSSNVASIGYAAESLTLEVEFKSGGVYQYFDVPQAEYLQLIAADSVGTYLNQNIKDCYRYCRI